MPPYIVGDPGRLKQMTVNLISNAIKFTDVGEVRITVKRDGEDQWLISVSDTGIGIPPHAQEYIFDKFRQIDGQSTRKHGGSGLGLAIVRNLAMVMGGGVRVNSVVGKGSTFSVLLPLQVATDVPDATRSSVM
jgi:signal transduction histidine kinase